MDICICRPSLTSSSSSSILYGVSSERLIEFCSSAASAVICNIFYAFSCFFSGIVGASLGAITGALIGLKTKSGFFCYTVVGAISGVVLVFEASFVFWHSENDGPACLHHLFDIFTSLFDGRLLHKWCCLHRPNPQHDQERTVETTSLIPRLLDTRRGIVSSKGSLDKIHLIRVSKRNSNDDTTLANEISCSICLQDFQLEEEAGILPACQHKFHQNCISMWVVAHNSCPLCRRNL